MARQRSIYDASYQTPLADFLEQIPDYFLKWEALKLQNKKYDNEQAYRAARDKESDRRWTLTQQNQIHQRDFDAKKLQLSDELKHISMAPIKQQDALYEKIKPTYIKHPEFTGLINSRISANDAVEGVADRHLDIQSKISDYKASGKSNRFGSHYDMLEDRQELSKLSKEVHGTSYQSEIDADIAKLDEWLEFSKQNADKPMPKNLWEHELDRTNYNQAAQQRSADVKLSEKLAGEIAQERAALVVVSADKTDLSYTSGLEKINQKENRLKNLVGWVDDEGKKIKGQIDESSSVLYGIEQNNKWNPLGGTTKVLEGGVFGYEPKTEMKEPDIERYILNNPEQGFDAWMDFITNPSEESENKFSSMLNEFIEDPAKPIEKVIEPIQEIITDDTTDDIEDEEEQTREERWASNIKTEEKIPEDIPKAWTEPATERDTDIDLSSIVEPLIARSDKGTEATIKEREKEAGESELFPEPLKSTNVKYIISDITKSGRDTGKVRGYVHSYLGGNLKQLKDLRKRVPILEGRGDKYNLKQINEKISSLENKIRESIGDYVNPETGEFSNPEYTKRIYRSLKRTLPDLQMRELMDLLRDFSTAQGTSKAVTLEPVSTSEDGTVYSASN